MKCTFDVHVDIFQLMPERHLALGNLGFDLASPSRSANSRRSSALLGQHPRMGDRAANILAIQAMIETNTLAKGFQPLVGSRENATTGW